MARCLGSIHSSRPVVVAVVEEIRKPRVTAQRTEEQAPLRAVLPTHGKALISEASRVGTPWQHSVVAEVVRQHQVRMRPRVWRVPVVRADS